MLGQSYPVCLMTMMMCLDMTREDTDMSPCHVIDVLRQVSHSPDKSPLPAGDIGHNWTRASGPLLAGVELARLDVGRKGEEGGRRSRRRIDQHQPVSTVGRAGVGAGQAS